jgi:hypothetical protein
VSWLFTSFFATVESAMNRPHLISAAGFRLVELLLFIAMIRLLISLTIRAVQASREPACTKPTIESWVKFFAPVGRFIRREQFAFCLKLG